MMRTKDQTGGVQVTGDGVQRAPFLSHMVPTCFPDSYNENITLIKEHLLNNRSCYMCFAYLIHLIFV